MDNETYLVRLVPWLVFIVFMFLVFRLSACEMKKLDYNYSLGIESRAIK